MQALPAASDDQRSACAHTHLHVYARIHTQCRPTPPTQPDSVFIDIYAKRTARQRTMTNLTHTGAVGKRNV